MKGKATVSLEVFNPTGMLEMVQEHAPRLDNLNGKTICELSHFGWESMRTFPYIRKLLKQRFPGVKIIPCTEFPNIYGVDPAVLSRLLKEKGCDGAIVGNAA
ncbi:MAG: hypothetical protein ABIH70_03780 [Chloroflexota bacterium]